MLGALGKADIPVPCVHALCTDLTVIGSMFYVIDFVPGRVFLVQAAPDWALHSSAYFGLRPFCRASPNELWMAPLRVRMRRRLAVKSAPLAQLACQMAMNLEH
ncbi:phosphotransferase [Bradyrhizobium diazoefficiens]|nr:phosphotransferase [Bradyrhizobium diazoefficiens]